MKSTTTFKGALRIEMFPFGKTFTDYMGELRADKRRHHEPTEYDQHGGGTRSAWDRHEFGMTPNNGQGDWQTLGEKDWPDESPTSLDGFTAKALELAADFLGKIDDAIKRNYYGKQDHLLDPAHVWQQLGLGFESFYKNDDGRIEVAHTFPGDCWLGGDFARVTLIDPVRISALKKLEEIGEQVRAATHDADQIEEEARAARSRERAVDDKVESCRDGIKAAEAALEAAKQAHANQI